MKKEDNFESRIVLEEFMFAQRLME